MLRAYAVLLFVMACLAPQSRLTPHRMLSWKPCTNPACVWNLSLA